MTKFERYIDLQADFYHYMVTFGGITKKTSSDYVTRMKFLSHDYLLDETLTKERIDDILRQEAVKQQNRAVYNNRKSLQSFMRLLCRDINGIAENATPT